MMSMRAFLHSFNKHENFSVICSGHNRKEKMFQKENMMFQKCILGCAGFPDQNQEDADRAIDKKELI